MRAYSVQVWRVTAYLEPLCARMVPMVDMATGTLASLADPRENTRGLAPAGGTVEQAKGSTPSMAGRKLCRPNVLVGRGEDGQDETWALTPARWPLPRHCSARIFFIARAFSHVGPLL